ncbi:hypothetical protein ACFU6R_24675 [Streptomyces sp. NPDC057499]|uniref:hypothetical protein n=1 Tax=Streptomyces sp. NPDC057499 TaxID=3346150 RepID=UPI00368E7AEB
MPAVITAGQHGDSPQFEPVREKVPVRRVGPGRPRTRPNQVRADKTYASRKKRGSRGGRPPRFDKVDHRERHYEKLAVRYEAAVLVAAINGLL